MRFFQNFRQLINHPDTFLTERAEQENWVEVLIPIVLTILVLAVFPIRIAWGSPLKILGSLFLLTFLISGTYLLSCLALYLVGRLLHSEVTYRQIITTWGFSYYPLLGLGLFLVISHALVPEGVPLFELGVFFTLLTVTFMISLLLWKIVLYFAEMRAVFRLTILQTLLASVMISALFILFWIVVGSLSGMQIPTV